MSVNPISPAEFQGGQMTDLPEFSGTLDGTELMEVVAAGAGQSVETEGVNYSITTALLATLMIELTIASVVISDGEYNTPGDPFTPTANTARIYINKTVAEPTYILFDPANDYSVEPLIKDVAGTVDAGSEVTVTFSGAEEADGNATVLITSPYGGYFFRPIDSLGQWTLGSA